MSLNEAKIRATPKTSSPVAEVSKSFAKLRFRGGVLLENAHFQNWIERTISDLGAEGDVLLGGSCGFLWWHFGRCGIELS